MPVAIDYQIAVREAEREIREARSADEVRGVWKRYLGTLGHRTLGRLLLGRSAAELVARLDARAED